MKKNTFSEIPIEPIPRTTVDEEMKWLEETYALPFYLIRRSLIASIQQRIIANREPEKKEYWEEVVNRLKNY